MLTSNAIYDLGHLNLIHATESCLSLTCMGHKLSKLRNSIPEKWWIQDFSYRSANLVFGRFSSGKWKKLEWVGAMRPWAPPRPRIRQSVYFQMFWTSSLKCMGREPWFGWKPGEEVGELVRVRGGVSCVAGLRGTTHVELKRASYHSAYTVL